MRLGTCKSILSLMSASTVTVEWGAMAPLMEPEGRTRNTPAVLRVLVLGFLHSEDALLFCSAEIAHAGCDGPTLPFGLASSRTGPVLHASPRLLLEHKFVDRMYLIRGLPPWWWCHEACEVG